MATTPADNSVKGGGRMDRKKYAGSHAPEAAAKSISLSSPRRASTSRTLH